MIGDETGELALARSSAGDPAAARDAGVAGLDGGAAPAAPSVLSQILARGRLRATLAILGPAFVAAVAYVDPGNFATNFQAGAEHGYLLVWVVVMANLIAMLVQYQTSKLGLASGHSLPDLCRRRFGTRANLVLWMQAEVVAMATDLAEFTGAALGLHLVFGIGLFEAGLLTAVVAFAVLGLEQRGYRAFELAIIALLMLVALGLLVDFFAIGHQSWGGIAGGVVPRLHGAGSLSLAVGIIGATVMPHVVYLHSALQSHRIRPANAGETRKLLSFNRLDCIVGLSLAGIVNLAMLCAAAALFHGHGLPAAGGIEVVHSHLGAVVGGGAALAFGVSLIASGLSSSSVGTYAGQIVMSGFVGWRIPIVVRRLVTMVPSLLVLALAVDTTTALVYSQIVLSFGIPFALVPLAMLTADRGVVGEFTNRRLTSAALWLVTAVIVVLNVYLIVSVI